MPEPSLELKEEVLRYLDEKSPIQLSPGNIAKNIGYSSGYVSRACVRLHEDGFLDREAEGGDPFYSLTDRGRAYLSGDLDVDELE